MTTYEVLTTDNQVITMTGDSPEHACQRVADLHGVTVQAWRHPRTALVIGAEGIDG